MDVLATLLSALSAPRQHERLLRLHTSLGPDVLIAESLDGRESLDEGGFRFELTALSIDAHLDLSELLGQPVRLELMTADAVGDLRCFHGHLSAFERIGSNGGLARYRLIVEPWLAFLRQRVDAFVFQDMTVVEIVESLFADYAGQGRLAPAWRWDLSDPSVYKKRSLTCQYEESDYDFLHRLLAEEGIHYHVEHSDQALVEDGAQADESSLGMHTLVLADHNEAFADLGSIRFHRKDITEPGDSVQHWSTARRWQTARLQRSSWDYRSLDLRPASALGRHYGEVAPEDQDIAGPYAYPDRATGERYARQHLEALQVSADTVQGAGSWRRLRPGGRFVLTQHHAYSDTDSGRFTCLSVRHRARNNLGAQVLDLAEKQLGPVTLAVPVLPDALSGLATPSHEGFAPDLGEAGPAVGNDAIGGEGFYLNSFDALPAAVPYRSRTTDGHGLRLHPKPTVHGSQTAIVVSDGAPLQTDRDHRIKVQFPWQRGGDASNRLAHPSGDDNAPGLGQAWTWVRVAGPWAGDNWGGVMLPRKGQEVVVAFLEGDIDRPVVIGTVYNGRGQLDAAHNDVSGGAGGATGNAAAWFEGNEHPSVFTGFKTQALAESQGGSGGYQQLKLDDTPGQGRVQANTTQHLSTLALGHLKGGVDNIRGQERGFGAELSTQAGGALRGGAGLLLTTEPGTHHLTATVAQSQLAQSEQLIRSLSEVAQTQQAILPDDPKELSAQTALKTTQDTMAATQTGTAPGEGIGGGDGSAPGWSNPLLLASSPKGIVSVTAQNQVWVSGTQTVLSADQDLQWLSQTESVLAVAGGIALFTHGGEAPSGKPNQERGIALHAAKGAVSLRAHKELARAAAKTSVKIASTQADVQIAAPSKRVLATAAGAYLKLEGGDIELGAPGTIEFKSSQRNWTTPASASAQASLPTGHYKGCAEKLKHAATTGGARAAS